MSEQLFVACCGSRGSSAVVLRRFVPTEIEVVSVFARSSWDTPCKAFQTHTDRLPRESVSTAASWIQITRRNQKKRVPGPHSAPQRE